MATKMKSTLFGYEIHVPDEDVDAWTKRGFTKVAKPRKKSSKKAESSADNTDTGG